MFLNFNLLFPLSFIFTFFKGSDKRSYRMFLRFAMIKLMSCLWEEHHRSDTAAFFLVHYTNYVRNLIMSNHLSHYCAVNFTQLSRWCPMV